MSAPYDDRIAVLNYFKEAHKRMREIAQGHPGEFGQSMLLFADTMADDTAELEAELIASGYLPRAANEP